MSSAARSDLEVMQADTLRHLARSLAYVSGRPELLPQPIGDHVHELLVGLEAAGVAPPATLNVETDSPSQRLPLDTGSRAPVVSDDTIERCRGRWTWHGSVPVDEEASETLVGIALVSQDAARAVHQSVPAEAWPEPSMARLVHVATEVGDADRETAGGWTMRLVNGGQSLDVTDIEGCARRVTEIAEASGEDRTRLVSLIRSRVRLHDLDGSLAARVIAAARARDDVSAHVTALERYDLHVGVGLPVDGIRDRLASYASSVKGNTSPRRPEDVVQQPACSRSGLSC